MVRQAHHVFIIQYIQDAILSLSKDDIWIPEAVRNKVWNLKLRGYLCIAGGWSSI